MPLCSLASLSPFSAIGKFFYCRCILDLIHPFVKAMLDVDGGLSVAEVLRQAGNHFARTKRHQKNTSGLDAREVERYREFARKCSFAGQGSGFTYHPSFAVGESLFQFLAPSKLRSSRLGKFRHACRHRPRLKLLIPDTLVLNVDDDPQWFYTDKNGFVACMAQYQPGKAVEQFGDVRYDNDLTAVRKQSCLLPCSGLREGDDLATLYSNGNSISLMNTRDLRVVAGSSAGVTGVAGADGGAPFVVQKFVKSKGPHAFIVRQAMERGRPPTAWTISNRQSYGTEINGPDSLLLAGPELLDRFVTTPTKNQACGIAKLGPGACVETTEAVGRLLRHLEAVLDRRLEVLVCDFTRDDRGRLWFLQVKAFRFFGCTPRRPFRLTVRARQETFSRLRGRHPSSLSEIEEKQEGSIFLHNSEAKRVGDEGREVSGDEGRRAESRVALTNGGGARFKREMSAFIDEEDEDSTAGGGEKDIGRKNTEKKMACGMCGALLNTEDIPFRMTTRMVRDTLFHIWRRLSPQHVPRSLLVTDNEKHAGDATAAAAASIARPTSGGNLSVAGAAVSVIAYDAWSKHTGACCTPSANATYADVRVCEACFMLYQAEASLVQAENRLATAARGASKVRSKNAAGLAKRRGTEMGESLFQPVAGHKNRIVGDQISRVEVLHGAGGGGGGGHTREERTAVGALDIPAELTLCRLLVAVIDILDVPRAFLKEAASRSRFLQLRYDLFGRREVIRLKNPLLRERGAIAGEGVINDKETNPSLRTEPERLERVQVKYFRVFSFLAADTPLEGDLPKGSGLDTFITCQREVTISLNLTPRKKTRADGGHRRAPGSAPGGVVPNGGFAESWTGRAGEARLGLGQFRNGHIQKIELQAPLIISGGPDGGRSKLLLMKAFLGLERVRSKVSVSTLSSPPMLHHGVYVMDTDGDAESEGNADGYHICDPLPDEWVEIGRTSLVARTNADEVPKNGVVKHRGTRKRPAVSGNLVQRQQSVSEEVMEGYPSSVWGLCICVTGVHRPKGLVSMQTTQDHQHHQQQEQQHEQETSGSTDPVDKSSGDKNDKPRNGAQSTHSDPAVSPPTPNDPRGWKIRCLLFGNIFYAERLMSPPPSKTAGDNEAGSGRKVEGGPGEGALDLALGGVEMHAYLQCDISRLRRLLGGGGGSDGTDAVLNMELLHTLEEGEKGIHERREIVRRRCEVPLDALVESRYIEGTYPLLNVRNHAHGASGEPSSCLGGTFNPSLELAVHLYRMGPLSAIGSGKGGMNCNIAKFWKPPSLVKKGQVGHAKDAGVAFLFERPPVEPRVRHVDCTGPP